MTDAVITPPLRAYFRGDSRFVLVGAVFLSLLLIGGDRVALSMGGLNLRLNFIPLLAGIVALWLNRDKPIRLEPGLCYGFTPWTVAALLTCFNSFDPAKSIAYTAWMVFTFLVIITLFYNYAQRVPVRTTFKMWNGIYRMHAIAALGEMALRIASGSFERPHLWFYETSYLAIFMSAYFVASLYMFVDVSRRRHLFDLLLSTVTLMALASATALAAIILGTLLVIAVARRRMFLISISLIFASAIVATVFIWLSETAYFRLMFSFLVEQDNDLLFNIITRAGNRYPRFLIGWEAFLSHPWLGIGIGADEAYMLHQPLSDTTWQYLNRFSEVDEYGFPFINITVEVMGSMGIIGLLPFLGMLAYAAWRAFRLPDARSPEGYLVRAVFLGFFTIFLVLQVEASFLRYYLWAPLGLALGMADRHIHGIKS